MILNPVGKYYPKLRRIMESEYSNNVWPEDAIVLERNSRDFITRNERINLNAETVAEMLSSSTFGWSS